MGYTGAGINRERAHLHLELDLLLSLRFDDWHKRRAPGRQEPPRPPQRAEPLRLDFPTLLLALQKNPDLTIPAFLKTAPVYYKVTVPRRGPLEIDPSATRGCAVGDHTRPSPSWETQLQRLRACRSASPPATAGPQAPRHLRAHHPVPPRILHPLAPLRLRPPRHPHQLRQALHRASSPATSPTPPRNPGRTHETNDQLERTPRRSRTRHFPRFPPRSPPM